MSAFNFSIHDRRRKRALASVAVAALVASVAVGGIEMYASAPANAAAVVTSDLQSQTMPSFANVVERVKPAVVSVKVNIEDASADSGNLSGQMDNLPPQVREFFKRFGSQDGGVPQRQSPRHVIGQGSGFFISADGYIVTNNHVVDHATTVTLTTDAGKVLEAKVIGTDPKTDLALLKVTEKGDYPFVSFAKAEPRVGDWVVAIGNPFGLGGTVTAGIISAEGRDIGSGPYDQYLQIDAPINKGNSGGPTFNMKGEVVGVNTAIYSPSGGSVGVGFAIPASTVDSVVDSLEHGGFVARGYLGVHDSASQPGYRRRAGAQGRQRRPDRPGATRYSGRRRWPEVRRCHHQAERRTDQGRGGPYASCRIAEAGRESRDFLPSGRRGKDRQTSRSARKRMSSPRWRSTRRTKALLKLGVRLAPAAQVAGAGDQGVAIVNVDPDGLAATKGLAEGDVILNVSGKPVSQPSEVKSEIAAAKQDGKKAVLMKIKTAQGERFVAFEFPKA